MRHGTSWEARNLAIGTALVLLLLAGPASATVECAYVGSGCNDGYTAVASFECISGSTLRILITNTSLINAGDPGNNVLSSLTFGGAAPAPSFVNRATVATGSSLLPAGKTDCSGIRNGGDITCEWSAGVNYCANGPLCDGIDSECRSPVAQCGLSFVSSRQQSDIDCSRDNFLLEPGSIDPTTNGADFGVIGATQTQPEGGFERVSDTVEIVLDVDRCTESAAFCSGVATYGPHFRHAPGAVATSTPPAAIPEPPHTTVAFVTALSGLKEVPPNAAPARGSAVATLNSDQTLTYAVSSTGFDTRFLGAHVHSARPGVSGPILFPLSCDSEGTTCSGTSPPLNAGALAALLAGDTYVNMHTDAFPAGEIRGQLDPTNTLISIGSANLRKFEGQAKPVGRTSSGRPRDTEIRINGRFRTSTALDLSTSTALINAFFDETGAGGELVRGRSGENVMPIPLRLARTDGRSEAVYRWVPNGPHPHCRLQVKGRGRQTYDFSLRCKRSDGATMPEPPTLCERGRRPTTELMTSIIVNAGSPWIVMELHPWRCSKSQGRVRELKSLNQNRQSGSGTAAGGNRAPLADFRPDPRRGNAPLTVTFNNRSSDPDGRVVSYDWNFGDGATSFLREPTHTYVRPGEFDVTLIVTDNAGLSSAPARLTMSVKANRPPLADFRADPRRGDAPLTVSFDNRSTDPDGAIVAYGWTFGDGTGSVAENPTHTYTRPGEYVVTLLVRDDQGITSEPKREIITASSVASPSGGNGGDGDDDANHQPRADFRMSVRSGIAPVTVAFTDRSTDADGTVERYHWNFGDGAESNVANPIHTYERSGQFIVTLTVTDNQGSSSDAKRETITVSANRSPLADFRATPRRGDSPLTVVFEDRSSDADGQVVEYLWTFGDGEEGGGPNPTHTYNVPGRFEVMLSVIDDRGATSEQPKREIIEVR